MTFAFATLLSYFLLVQKVLQKRPHENRISRILPQASRPLARIQVNSTLFVDARPPESFKQELIDLWICGGRLSKPGNIFQLPGEGIRAVALRWVARKRIRTQPEFPVTKPSGHERLIKGWLEKEADCSGKPMLPRESSRG